MRGYRISWFVLGAAALLPLLCGATRTRAAVLYGADGSHADIPGLSTNLYILNQANGAVISTVGPIRIGTTDIRIAGLAFHPTTGVLYGSTTGRLNPPGLDGALVTIDPGTGAATFVGSFGLIGSVTLVDLAFTPDGTLYGWSGQGGLAGGASDLYTVSLGIGLASQVADSSVNVPGPGLASNSAGTLFLTGLDTASLYTVPVSGPNPGEPVVVAPLSDGPQLGFIRGLDFDPDTGTLYGVNYNGGTGNPARLVTVDTTTGVVTDVGPLPIGLSAIAFQPSGPPPPNGVPEPSALALFGLGLAGLAGCWWRRARRQR